MIEPRISLDVILRAGDSGGEGMGVHTGGPTWLNNLRQRQRNHITSIMYQTLIHQLTEQFPPQNQTVASYQAVCPLSGPQGQKKPKTHLADGERKKMEQFLERVSWSSVIHSAWACSWLPEEGEKHRVERERSSRKRNDGDGGKKRGTREKVRQKESKDLLSWLIIACTESKKEKNEGCHHHHQSSTSWSSTSKTSNEWKNTKRAATRPSVCQVVFMFC